jgi:hypothetical protein
MKKIREVFETFEPLCKENISKYYATYTEEVKKFLIENDFNNNYRTYTVHKICNKRICRNRYRVLYVADDILFMVDYTVIKQKNGKPCIIEDVDDVEFPEKEELILPFSEWDTKGLSPEEYLLNEIKKYRAANMEKSDCVYHISSGHDGDLDLSFVVLFDRNKQKCCGVKFAHYPEWATGNELRIENVVKE